jgi:hypothetical protein
MTQKYDLNDQQPKPPELPKKRSSFLRPFSLLATTVVIAFGVHAWYVFVAPQRAPASITTNTVSDTPSTVAPPSVSAPTVNTVDTPQEPEKTTAELLKQVDDQIAAKQYEDADSTIKGLLDRVNPRSLTGISLLMKQGDAKLEYETSNDEAQKSYREALFGLENHYGALDAKTLPALKGLIAASEERDENDYKLGLELAQRYDSIVRRSSPVTIDSTADEAAAAAYIAEAQKRADAKKDDCLCTELHKSIKQAGERYGERSYVVALLMLKRAELDDQDPLDNADQPKPSDSASATPPVAAPVSAASPPAATVVDTATPEQKASDASDTTEQPADSTADDQDQSDTTLSEGQLQSVLAMIEQRFGPVDYRLEPALKRLIAINDEQGSHETADVLIARLGLLHERTQ